MFPSSKKITIAVLGPVLALSLVACGGSSSGQSATVAAPNPNATGAPGASGAPGGGNGRGFGGQNQAEFAKIQACLSAAGIALPTRTGFPRPSGSFTRNPDRTPGVRPSGANGRRFGGGGMFADPKVQAALKACGITPPTFGPRPSGAPSA